MSRRTVCTTRTGRVAPYTNVSRRSRRVLAGDRKCLLGRGLGHGLFFWLNRTYLYACRGRGMILLRRCMILCTRLMRKRCKPARILAGRIRTHICIHILYTDANYVTLWSTFSISEKKKKNAYRCGQTFMIQIKTSLRMDFFSIYKCVNSGYVKNVSYEKIFTYFITSSYLETYENTFFFF